MNTNFDFSKPIAVGCDHAGFEYKVELLKHLNKLGYQVCDFGTYSADSVDYPDFAHPTAASVENGEAAFGVLICGSANGVCMTANKHKGIRAALCWQRDVAEITRKHNNANIICIPARFVSFFLCVEMIETFIKTAFEGGRHQERIQKMNC
jgi:ribose 5-phosphate isomerase B